MILLVKLSWSRAKTPWWYGKPALAPHIQLNVGSSYC